MIDAFVWSIFLALILLGTVAICYVIMLKLLLPNCNEDYYVLLPCNFNTTNIRKKAYGLRIKLNLLGEEKYGKILIIDDGLSIDEKDSLMEICTDYNGIYYVEKDRMKGFFDGRI